MLTYQELIDLLMTLGTLLTKLNNSNVVGGRKGADY